MKRINKSISNTWLFFFMISLIMINSELSIQAKSTDYSDLVISEILYDTVSTDIGCFIEIYNGGSSIVNLDNMIVEGINGANGEIYASISLSGTLSSGAYYVIGQDATITSDQIDSGVNLQNGPDGVRLVDSVSEEVIDGLHYGEIIGYNTTCLEGITSAEDVESGYSLTRDALNTDTDENSDDFHPTLTHTPGEVGIITDFDLVISEILYDNVGIDAGCFIEIYNAAPVTVDLDASSNNIIIECVNGATEEVYIAVDLNGSVEANSYYVLSQDDSVSNFDQIYSGLDPQNGADGIRLVDNTTKVELDGLQYGDGEAIHTGCKEGDATVDTDSGNSLTRDEYNTDTNDNAWDFFEATTPTPGTLWTSPNVNSLKISEVLYDTVSIDTGCFIEIWNGGTLPINLDHKRHDIVVEGVNGANGEVYANIDLTGTINAKSYYIIAQDDSIWGNQIDPIVDFQNGADGVRLVDNTTRNDLDSLHYGEIIGYNISCLEGLTPAIDVESGYSLSRNENNTDTDENGDDFHPTLTHTPGQKGQITEINLLITEILYDNLGVDSGCFIEIYNAGSIDINLDNYKNDIIIECVNGATGEIYLTIDLLYTITAGDYYVVAQDDTVANYDQINSTFDPQNGADGVRLIDNNTKVEFDSLQYGETDSPTGCLEGTPAVDVNSSYSLTRDGYNTDTNNNSLDFLPTDTPTPGTAPDIPATSESATNTTDVSTIETTQDTTSEEVNETTQPTSGIGFFMVLITAISIVYRRQQK